MRLAVIFARFSFHPHCEDVFSGLVPPLLKDGICTVQIDTNGTFQIVDYIVVIMVLVQTAPRVGDDRQMPRFVPVEELFKGRHFDQEIVALCVRWSLSYKLSSRDLVAMMAEQGIGLVHTTAGGAPKKS